MDILRFIPEWTIKQLAKNFEFLCQTFFNEFDISQQLWDILLAVQDARPEYCSTWIVHNLNERKALKNFLSSYIKKIYALDLPGITDFSTFSLYDTPCDWIKKV